MFADKSFTKSNFQDLSVLKPVCRRRSLYKFWVLFGPPAVCQTVLKVMASVGVAPTSGLKDVTGTSIDVDRLLDEMNEMKIKDEKVMMHFQLFPLYHFSIF